MKTIELIIVRHGKTQWNQSGLMQGVGNSPLLAESKKALKKIHINYTKKPVIFTSDLGRAMSTARGIANKFPATIIRDARLRERYFGVVEGHSVRREEKYIQYQDAVHNRHLRKEFNVPGAEQIDEMLERMHSWLDYIKRSYADNSIILVCHGEWTRVFLNLIEGREPWEKGPGIIPNATPIYKTLNIK